MKNIENLPISKRSSLPAGSDCIQNILLQLLDSLDAQIILFDQESRIRYFSTGYFLAYRHAFEEQHIEPEQILNMKLSDLKGDSRDFVLRAISSRERKSKEFYTEPTTNYSGLFDIVPIDTDEFSGTAIIQQQNQQLEKAYQQLSHYKHLLNHIETKLDEKESLPLHFQRIIGHADNFLQVLRMSAQVAKSSTSVCILGESGSGKEVLAEAIHYSSGFANGPFIKVNCASIPESLMESELFGYEKGAFTGANAKGGIGKLEAANKGTLFLDELGEMPKSMQVKLLRALQEHEITRIGSNKTVKLNFRLITATNRNLEQMVKDGDFREDLYYRVCIVPISIPPLRERRSDIPMLANHFLASLDQGQWQSRSFSEETLDLLSSYSWPGNIRELKNCVERMSILCPDEEISAEYLPPNINENGSGSFMPNLSQYNLKKIVEQVEYETDRWK